MDAGFSVLVTSWNGASRLPAALAAIAAQRAPSDVAWEVVVVDNASTDGTAELARRSWPRNAPAPIRVVTEPTPGVLHANLRGLREVRFALVGLVNDDNRPEPGWLRSAAESLRAHPGAAAVGGRGIAVSEQPLPSWFDRFQRHYAVGPQAEAPGPLRHASQALWGAGTVYRTAAWRWLLAAGFAPRLVGPQGAARAAGEDYELSYALRLAGWELRYEPDLAFHHHIPAARLEWRWHRRMHRSFGAAIGLDAYVEALEGRERPLSGRLRCRWAAQALSSAAGLLRFAAHFVAGDRLPGDPAVARADQLWGRLRELLRRRSEYDRWLRDVRGAAWRRPIR